MAGERRLNWGADATDAKYRSGDDDTNGRFIVAEDLDGGTVLLEWDESANSGSGGWVFRGPVDLGSNDLSTTGQVSAGSVSAGEVDITGLSTGQIHLIESANINDKKEYQRAIQFTDVTASTATNIFKASNLAESDVQLLELMVCGTDQTANSRNFYDRVAFAFGDSTNVTELATSAAPPSRSYAVVNDVDLELTISDGYDVVVKGELYNVSL